MFRVHPTGFQSQDFQLHKLRLKKVKFYKFDLPKATTDYHNRMVKRSNYLKARDINYVQR